MLVRLPPGMTREQYYQTPEGRAVAARGEAFARESAERLRRNAVQFADPPLRKKQTGQAQPITNSYETATRPPADVAQQIFETLEEMFPEMSSGDMRSRARELAEEYRVERYEAMESLRPPGQEAPMTEQMEFDQAYSDMEGSRRAEERMKARMERQLREERVNAMQSQAPRGNTGQSPAGGSQYGVRPQWQMDGLRPDARGNAPAQAASVPMPSPGTAQQGGLQPSYKEWVAAGKPGYDPTGMYAMVANEWGRNAGEAKAHHAWVMQGGGSAVPAPLPSIRPGNAQPIPPSTGTPYGEQVNYAPAQAGNVIARGGGASYAGGQARFPPSPTDQRRRRNEVQAMRRQV